MMFQRTKGKFSSSGVNANGTLGRIDECACSHHWFTFCAGSRILDTHRATSKVFLFLITAKNNCACVRKQRCLEYLQTTADVVRIPLTSNGFVRQPFSRIEDAQKHFESFDSSCLKHILRHVMELFREFPSHSLTRSEHKDNLSYSRFRHGTECRSGETHKRFMFLLNFRKYLITFAFTCEAKWFI